MRAAMFVLVAVLTLPAAALPVADPPPKVVVTSPRAADVVVTQQYPGRVLAQRHIELHALVTGYIEQVLVKEGQAVRKGDVLFKIVPTLYKTRLDVAVAEVRVAQVELGATQKLFDKKVVGPPEVALAEAKLALAQAKAKQAEAELNFTAVRAPFDGLLGRLQQQEGSLVTEKDALTTLSDNSVMWVYFHVSEARYLEYKARQGNNAGGPSRLELPDSRIELVLADGRTFDQTAGNVVTVEATFNPEAGTISFRADFPNPDLLLRHGQTGTVAVRRTLKSATVIPRRAAVELIAGWRVYVVGKDDVARLRRIEVGHELDDTFIISKGLDATDRIVLEGVQRLRDGDKVEYEYRKPEEAADRPKPGPGK